MPPSDAPVEMSSGSLRFGSRSSFDPGEQSTLRALWAAIETTDHPGRDSFLEVIQDTVGRVDGLAAILESYPSVLGQQALGARRRDISTLVDDLVQATEANYEFFLPTRALVGRALLMAELNAWRLFRHTWKEAVGDGAPGSEALRRQLDACLHGCIFARCTEELLGSISHDPDMERRVRERAVRNLANLWEQRLSFRVKDFFPLLAYTWEARHRIRVSIGTMLGVSEIFRLLQAGCDPQFVNFFSRPRLTDDEQGAFLEFLIGVPTEDISSLAQLMEKTGRKSLSPEEAADALGRELDFLAPTGEGVRAYEFFRERHLQAAARKLKGLPGPKRTAEEYVMTYFLEHQETGPAAGAG